MGNKCTSYVGLYFWLFLAFSLPANVASAEKKTGDTNTVFIRKFHEYFYIKALTSQKIFSLAISDNYTPGYTMTFKPNLGSYLGLGVFMFDLGIDLSFRLPQSQESIETYGKTKGLDLQAHIYTRKHGVDLSYQEYKGFYLDNPEKFYPTRNSADPYPTKGDMEARNIHVGTYYVFKSERFSFPSIFNQTEAQLKSGGSWFISGQMDLSDLKDPVSIVPLTDTNNFKGLTNLKKVNALSISVLPGYSYNIVLFHKFYINLSLALGAGYQIRSYTAEQSYKNNSLALANTWRFGGGFNGRRLFFGFNAYLQRGNVQIENLNIETQSGFTRIFLGYRFREWGFMQKSIFNLFQRKNKA